MSIGYHHRLCQRLNLGGLISPFMQDKLLGLRLTACIIAVEPASCPSLPAAQVHLRFL